MKKALSIATLLLVVCVVLAACNPAEDALLNSTPVQSDLANVTTFTLSASGSDTSVSEPVAEGDSAKDSQQLLLERADRLIECLETADTPLLASDTELRIIAGILIEEGEAIQQELYASPVMPDSRDKRLHIAELCESIEWRIAQANMPESRSAASAPSQNVTQPDEGTTSAITDSSVTDSSVRVSFPIHIAYIIVILLIAVLVLLLYFNLVHGKPSCVSRQPEKQEQNNGDKGGVSVPSRKTRSPTQTDMRTAVTESVAREAYSAPKAASCVPEETACEETSCVAQEASGEETICAPEDASPERYTTDDLIRDYNRWFALGDERAVACGERVMQHACYISMINNTESINNGVALRLKRVTSETDLLLLSDTMVVPNPACYSPDSYSASLAILIPDSGNRVIQPTVVEKQAGEYVVVEKGEWYL